MSVLYDHVRHFCVESTRMNERPDVCRQMAIEIMDLTMQLSVRP